MCRNVGLNYAEIINCDLFPFLKPTRKEYNNNGFIFSGDSNTEITKGLLSLLIRIYSNCSPKEIIDSNLFFIEKIGLNRFIGTQRSNGLKSMENKFKIFALSNI